LRFGADVCADPGEFGQIVDQMYMSQSRCNPEASNGRTSAKAGQKIIIIYAAMGFEIFSNFNLIQISSKNNKHCWVPKVSSITTISYTPSQIFEYFISCQFRMQKFKLCSWLNNMPCILPHPFYVS
jgi:hypothetical protein